MKAGKKEAKKQREQEKQRKKDINAFYNLILYVKVTSCAYRGRRSQKKTICLILCILSTENIDRSTQK